VATLYVCRHANFKFYHRKFLLYKHNTLFVILCYFNTIFPDLSYREIATIFPPCFNFKITFGADTEKETRSVSRKRNVLQSASVKTSRHRPKQRRVSASMQVHSTALT